MTLPVCEAYGENEENFACVCDGKNISVSDDGNYMTNSYLLKDFNLFVEIGTLTFHVYFYLLTVSQCDYRYHKKENLEVTESSIWRTYVVMTELLCRIGPCIILVTLNILMIRDFKKSIKRRSNLKNTHYKDKRNKAYRWKSHVQYQYKNTGM